MGRVAHTIEHFYLAKDSRGNWNVQWVDPDSGKTKRRGTGCKSEKAAQAKMPAIVVAILNPPPPAGATVDVLLDDYIAWRTSAHCPKGPPSPTFEDNFTHIRKFFAGYTPDKLTDVAWDAYRAHRTAMPVRNAGAAIAKKNGKPVRFVSDSTACRELNALRGAIGWAQGRQWPGFQEVQMELTGQETNPRGQYLTRAEFSRLLTALEDRPHLTLFCRLSVATGARMSALLELKWFAVTMVMGFQPMREPDLEETNGETLLLSWPKGGKGPVLSAPIEIDLGRGKGNKKRPSGLISPTNVNLWRDLLNAHTSRKTDYVIEYRGKPIKSVDLSDAFERANIPQAKRTQHVLKHTCCSWLVQAGREYGEIAKLVGTTAATIEKFYGHLSPKQMAAVGDVLSV